MKKSLALLAAALMLTLTACGGTEAPVSTVSPSASPAQAPAAEVTPSATSPAPCNDPSCDPNNGLFPVDGKFEFTSTYGTTGTFTFDDKADPEVEALRKIGKVKPLHYMNVKVDNRSGSVAANMLSVTAYDPDGKKYEYTGISDMIGEWRGVVDLDVDGSSALYNRFIDAGNAHLDSIDVSEAGVKILAYEGELPKGFTRVEVNASGGFDPVDAYLEGQAPPATDMDSDVAGASMTTEECMAAYAQITAEQNDMTVDEVMKDADFIAGCEAMEPVTP